MRKLTHCQRKAGFLLLIVFGLFGSLIEPARGATPFESPRNLPGEPVPPIWASTPMGSPLFGGMDRFRFSDLDLRDPHGYMSFLGCFDVTDNPLLGFSINGELQSAIQTDEDGDGLLDLSYVLQFNPFDPGLPAIPASIGTSACTAPLGSTTCGPFVGPVVEATAIPAASGTCLTPVGGTVRPYSPAITNAVAPCFASTPATVTIALNGIPITLHDAQLGATYVDASSTTLTNGLLRGFLTEQDANNTIIPASFPVIGGQPLSILFPGGDPPGPGQNCAAHNDKDIHMGVPGWWFYFNFPANRIARLPAVPVDFDGDRRADVSVFRPSDGNWHIDGSTAGYMNAVWGAGTDRLVAADYDGDNKTDIAVFRPSTGTWYILRSSSGTYIEAVWGNTADITTPGDFDNDGRADIAVFRPSDGNWHISGSSAGYINSVWGASGDLPVAGDYDADGKTDVAVFRPSNGTWYINRSTAGFYTVTWGNSTDRVVNADYDGDGRDDIAVWRPSDGNWHILKSSDGGYTNVVWGASGDVPVPGDYDGDGKADVSVVRNGTWHLNRSTAGYQAVPWGTGTDLAIPGRY